MGADTHSNIYRAYKANDTESLQFELENDLKIVNDEKNLKLTLLGVKKLSEKAQKSKKNKKLEWKNLLKKQVTLTHRDFSNDNVQKLRDLFSIHTLSIYESL
jgi:hypothetical protein